MTIAADIVTTLGATLSNKLYPMVAPAGVAAPYAIYQFVSDVHVTHFSGQSDKANARIQIQMFGRDYAALDALAESVKSVMDGATLFKSVCHNKMDWPEDTTHYYGILMDFSVWH